MFLLLAFAVFNPYYSCDFPSLNRLDAGASPTGFSTAACVERDPDSGRIRTLRVTQAMSQNAMQHTRQASFVAIPQSESPEPLLNPRQEVSHGNDLELRILGTNQAMIDGIGKLRVRAWKTEVPQAIQMVAWLDEFDQIARHWAFLRDGQPVAAARLSVHCSINDVPDSENYTGLFSEPPQAPIASFNRLVVDPTVRGMGLSEQLDRLRLDVAEAMQCQCVVLSTSAGPRRVTHLVKLGFAVVGQGNPCLHSPVCCATTGRFDLPPPTTAWALRQQSVKFIRHAVRLGGLENVP